MSKNDKWNVVHEKGGDLYVNKVTGKVDVIVGKEHKGKVRDLPAEIKDLIIGGVGYVFQYNPVDQPKKIMLCGDE